MTKRVRLALASFRKTGAGQDARGHVLHYEPDGGGTREDGAGTGCLESTVPFASRL